MSKFRSILVPAAVLPLAVALSGCSSSYVDATVTNTSPRAVSLVEVDYPSASFGMQTLDAHASYRYHFKIQGSGTLSVAFTTQDGKVHHLSGPEISEGQHGTLKISVLPDDSVDWNKNLSPARE